MRVIQLTQGMQALVDDTDYPSVSQFPWSFHAVTGYAVANIGNRHVVSMHRFLMGEGSSDEVDHKDRDKLNNQRSNLRFVTKSQNKQNRKRVNKWGYTGVARQPDGRFFAQIKVNYKNKTKCGFNTPLEAAIAYDKMAFEYYGPDAHTNFRGENGQNGMENRKPSDSSLDEQTQKLKELYAHL